MSSNLLSVCTYNRHRATLTWRCVPGQLMNIWLIGFHQLMRTMCGCSAAACITFFANVFCNCQSFATNLDVLTLSSRSLHIMSSYRKCVFCPCLPLWRTHTFHTHHFQKHHLCEVSAGVRHYEVVITDPSLLVCLSVFCKNNNHSQKSSVIIISNEVPSATNIRPSSCPSKPFWLPPLYSSYRAPGNTDLSHTAGWTGAQVCVRAHVCSHTVWVTQVSGTHAACN